MPDFNKGWWLVSLVGTAVLALTLAACGGGGVTSDQTADGRGKPPAVESPATRPAVESLSTPTSVGTVVTPTPPGEVATPADMGEAPSTPIIVRLGITKAPKLNEEVVVTLEVQAYRDAPGTTAQIELPSAARLVSGEPRWQGDLTAASPVRLTVTIAFTEEGEHTIRGTALRSVSADEVWGDDDYIYLTVKRDGGFFGFESGTDTGLTASPVPEQNP